MRLEESNNLCNLKRTRISLLPICFAIALINNAFSKSDDESAKKAADIIALNAGAAIYVSGVATTLQNGIEMAEAGRGDGPKG